MQQKAVREREALGGAVGRVGVGEWCRREFIVFQSRRGLKAYLSIRFLVEGAFGEDDEFVILSVAD